MVVRKMRWPDSFATLAPDLSMHGLVIGEIHSIASHGTGAKLQMTEPAPSSGAPSRGVYRHALCLQRFLFPPAHDALRGSCSGGQASLANWPARTIRTAKPRYIFGNAAKRTPQSSVAAMGWCPIP